jgi:DNA-binding LytR/AlgR family response regulator
MNCIVIDDEPLARQKLKMLIEKDDSLHLSGCFKDPAAASEFLELNPAELIFLDIQMPGFNGIDYAASLPPEAIVVFTTAYAEHAADSYRVNALDYLVKPISEAHFQQAVRKAKERDELLRLGRNSRQTFTGCNTGYMFIKADRKYHRVAFKDCLYLEGIRGYSVLHLAGRKLVLSMNLKTLQDQLPSDAFVRISKSYVVNLTHVTSLDHQEVEIGGTTLPVGNAYRAGLFERLAGQLIGKA